MELYFHEIVNNVGSLLLLGRSSIRSSKHAAVSKADENDQERIF